jgi:hypothetical protein
VRPRHKAHLLAAVVLAASALVGAAGRETMAAFTSATSNDIATLTAAPDYMPPAITAVMIAKNTGYRAGYVKQSGNYYVYANVSADTGNPASGISTVTADASSLTAGATSLALTSGSWTIEGVSYNYRTALQSADAGISEGSKAFSVTATDNASNSGTVDGNVTVDNTAPIVTGADIQMNNKAGGTAGRAESGDTVEFTYNETMDPSSILFVPAWTGASTNVTVRLNDGGAGNDTLRVYDNSNFFQTRLATVTLSNPGYVTTNRTFNTSTMVQSGSTITVTLGTASGGVGTVVAAGSPSTWVPSTSGYDRAANNFSTSAGTTVTESGGADVEF